MTHADMQRIAALGPEKCPPEVQEDCRLAVLAQIAAQRNSAEARKGTCE